MLEMLLGSVVGFVIGATGVGGGLLAAPALMLLFRTPPEVGVGVALAFSTAARLYAGTLYALRRRVDWGAAGRLLLGGLPGALAGPWLLARCVAEAPAGTLLVAIGLVVAVSASLGLLSGRLRRGPAGPPSPGLLPFAGLAIGTTVGFSSAGAGTLGALALLRWTRLEPSTVVGTDVAAGLALSAVASFAHFRAGSLDGALLGKLALGGLPGALAGVLVGTRLPAHRLRSVIYCWALALGGVLILQGLRR